VALSTPARLNSLASVLVGLASERRADLGDDRANHLQVLASELRAMSDSVAADVAARLARGGGT